MKNFSLQSISILAVGGLILAALSSCGGGGSSASIEAVNPVPPLLSGQFRDAPVEGLRFESTGAFGATGGLTDTGGQFKYRDGDQVAFFLGQNQIAKAAGAPLITPYSATTTDQEASNLARLLQSIDEDQDPNNGIRITNAVRSNAASLPVFNLKSELSDAQLQSIVNSLYPNAARTTISTANADAHAILSERLSLLRGNEVYDVVVGNKTYPTNFNKAKLEDSARARLYLYLWSKWQRPMMQTVLDNQTILINDIDALKRRNDNYIELADALGDLVLLSADVSKLRNALKSGESGNELIFKIQGGVVAGIISTIPAAQGVFSETEAAQKDDATNFGLAKAGAYAFGSLGGDVGSGINAAKEIVKATSDDPILAANADLIGVAAGAFFDSIIKDVESGKILIKGKRALGGTPGIIKDLTIFSARQVNAIAANPSVISSRQTMNSYLVAKDVLNLWYESAGDPAFIGSKLFSTGVSTASITEMVDKIARNYAFEEKSVFASDWNRSLAVSLVAEQLGRINALYRIYTARLGANSSDFVSTISGLPNIGQQNAPYTLSLNTTNNVDVEQVVWSVDDGRTVTKFTSRAINLVFDKTGTFTIQAVSKLSSGAISIAAAQINIVTPTILIPSVTAIGPLTVINNTTVTFEVSGRNLPLSAVLAIADAECSSSFGNTSIGFSQTCALRAAGSKRITVKSQAGASGVVISSSFEVQVALTPTVAPTDYLRAIEFSDTCTAAEIASGGVVNSVTKVGKFCGTAFNGSRDVLFAGGGSSNKFDAALGAAPRFMDGLCSATITSRVLYNKGGTGSASWGQILGAGDSRNGTDPISMQFKAFGKANNLMFTDTLQPTTFWPSGRGLALGELDGTFVTPLAAIPVNTWVSVAMVLEDLGSSQVARLYVDGAVVSETTSSSKACVRYDTDMQTRVGSIHGTQNWVGNIRFVRTFARALTRTELLLDASNLPN